MGYTVTFSRATATPLIAELGFQPCPRYSTRMSDAWRVVRHLWRKYRIRTTVRTGGTMEVTLAPPEGESIQAFQKRAPHAICFAAILAMEVH
jgi:hypothetical protein